MNEDDVRAIVRRFGEMEAQIERLNVKIANLVREGRVTDEIDYDTGLAEIEADGLPSRKIPWAQRAGGVKDWDPPSPGERVVVFAPGGDVERAIAFPGGWTDENPAPDNKGGNRTIVAAGDVSITAGGKITLTAATVEIVAGRIDFTKA